MMGYTPTPDYYNDYLAHYGVMGMKWGVRKNPEKAFLKAYKKHKKLQERSENYLTKDILKSRRKKLSKIKVSRRTNRAARKLVNWDDKVRKAFANTQYANRSLYQSPYVQIDPSRIKITKKRR